MKNKPLLLIGLLFLAVCLGSLTTGPARSQVEKPLTEETPAPQPVDTAAAQAAPPAATPPAHREPAGEAAPVTAAAVRNGGITEWFSRGGVFMWPILICSIVAAIFILERAYTLIKARTNTRTLMTDILTTVRRDGLAAAERVCEQTRGPIAAIVHSGLRQADKGPDAVEKAIETAGAVEMSFLERGLIWLATISTVAPLLGFLGTVSGMIHAFDAIAAADQVSAKLVAGGISEALITTEAGLIVAIPASLAHNFFLSQIDRFVVEMEESSSELVNTIVELR
jgi:biopolymer transport protein ExbB